MESSSSDCMLQLFRKTYGSAWYPGPQFWLVSRTSVLPGIQALSSAWYPGPQFYLVSRTSLLPGIQDLSSASYPGPRFTACDQDLNFLTGIQDLS